MMKCPKCGADITESAMVCEYCRYKLTNNSEVKDYRNIVQNNTNSPETKKNRRKWMILLIIIIGIMMISIFVSNLPKETKDTTKEINSKQVSQEEKQPQIDLSDNFIYNEEGAFMMAIEKVTKTGTQSVVAGRVQRGNIKINDSVEIVGLTSDTEESIVKKIAIEKESTEIAHVGDKVEITLDSTAVQKGQVLAKPGSLSVYSHIEITMDILTSEEGGMKGPIYNEFRPQFTVGGDVATGVITLLDNQSMAYPGAKKVLMDVELVDKMALEEGLNIHMMSGNKVIAIGKVTKVIE